MFIYCDKYKRECCVCGECFDEEDEKYDYLEDYLLEFNYADLEW